MYTPNPSKQLNDIFTKKPYQGVEPEKAKFIFVGLDANYAEDIESSPIFSKILEYHHDGVSFWEKYGVHHPFMLPGYSGSGKFYHKSFAAIGFKPEHASQVSFIELLDVPTTKSKLQSRDLNPFHLRYINNVIIDGKAEYVFISKTVVTLMYYTGAFPWLKKSIIGTEGPLGVLYQTTNKRIFSYLHLSNYGKFLEQKSREAEFIGRLINVFN